MDENDVFWKLKSLKIWNFSKSKKCSYWYDDFKKKSEKSHFLANGEFLAENEVSGKSKPLKKWHFDKNKNFRLDVTIKKKNRKKVIFSANKEFLAKNVVFGKSKPFKIWNFGKNKKVSSWCDNLKKKIKIKKNIFFRHTVNFLPKNTFFISMSFPKS